MDFVTDFVVFVDTGSGTFQGSANFSPATISDTDGNGTFEVGESLSLDPGTGSGVPAVFLGIVNINGTALPVVSINGGPTAAFVPGSADVSGIGSGSASGFTAADFNLDGSTPPPMLPDPTPEFTANFITPITSGAPDTFATTVALPTSLTFTSPDDDFDLNEMFTFGTPPDVDEYTYLGTTSVNGVEGFVFSTPSFADPVALFATDPGSTSGQTATVTSETAPICFAEGTRIATPTGDANVEHLSIGTLVMTADGRMVPVRWIGRQTVDARFAKARARPVRISAGALGNGLPARTLTVTQDHAMILDGLAVEARALINGTTITLAPAPTRATYYHVETDAHEVILAEGAPTESYIDYVARRAFDNYAEYLALYGEDRRIEEMPLPRIKTPAQHARANPAA